MTVNLVGFSAYFNMKSLISNITALVFGSINSVARVGGKYFRF